MTALWVIIGLVISAAAVSGIGATFSIVGLGDLFSGAKLAVWIMAGALEFSKFVLAAYLHQRWRALATIFKSYLLISVIILSAITSTGIFGFLSNAYQSASSTLELETTRLEGYTLAQKQTEAEIQRINQAIDEIPSSRITKKLQFRAENAPLLEDLSKKAQDLAKKIAEANLVIVEVKQKVGPLIYIARAFKTDLDTVVKYLVFVLVSVFDPLAICLVIAVSEAIEARKHYKMFGPKNGLVTNEKNDHDKSHMESGPSLAVLGSEPSLGVNPINLDVAESEINPLDPIETITMSYKDEGVEHNQRAG